MKVKALATGFFLIFSCFLHAQAQTQYGFKSIPFGLSYEETLRRIKKIKHRDGRDLSIYEGYNKRYFEVYSYWIGNQLCKIGFSFDHKKRFYQFTLYAKPSLDASYYDTQVKGQVTFFNKVFKKKYGQPIFCKEYPSLLDLEKGYVTTVCKWETNVLYAYTGISEDLEDEYEYHGSGTVGLRRLAEEYFDYQKKVGNKGVSKGVSDF
ncbi:MAG: hypothetical protein JRF08_00420 [Deltaproteobacteria bacterium]|nr:hypothetical protein [Deltaproteobacteria bacterium]MBW2331957.1 hypothetical protein [Deltaproteobacteria bacterium]